MDDETISQTDVAVTQPTDPPPSKSRRREFNVDYDDSSVTKIETGCAPVKYSLATLGERARNFLVLHGLQRVLRESHDPNGVYDTLLNGRIPEKKKVAGAGPRLSCLRLAIVEAMVIEEVKFRAQPGMKKDAREAIAVQVRPELIKRVQGMSREHAKALGLRKEVTDQYQRMFGAPMETAAPFREAAGLT